MEEEKIENTEEKKKVNSSKGIIIGLVIFIIILIGVIVTLLLKPDLFSTSTKSGEKGKANQQETKKTEKTTKEETKESDTIKEIDPTKPLNTNGNTYSDISDKKEDVGIDIKINDDKQSITISFHEKANKTIADVTHSTYTTETVEKTITGFNKNIKSTYISCNGQDVTGIVFYFLMEDNTIKFIKWFNQKTDASGNTYYDTALHRGESTILNVDNVDGIVKLYGANVSAPMSSGAHTTLAATKDGSFYDLGVIIK